MTYIFTILNFLYSSILPFVILLGILIFVHELGHFLVARMCGVRVEVFSLGFGKKLISYKRGDTTYCLSLIPLGGYVKMFGEQGSEAIKSEEDKKVSYSHKNPWQRIAVVLAGPLMNFVFAVFVFTLISEIGEQTRAAVVADVVAGSTAEQMGLKAGDKILEVNASKIKSYEDFQKSLNQFKSSTVSALIEDASGQQKKLDLQVTVIDNPNIFSLESKLGQVEGLLPYAKSAAVAVIVGSPAYQIGFRTADEIVEINSQKITRYAQLEDFLLNSKTTEDLNIKVKRSQEIKSEVAKASENLEKQTLTFVISQQQLQEQFKKQLKNSKSLKASKSIKDFGFDDTELYLDQVVKDSPAAAAGLQPYDKMISINAKPILKWEDISEAIKAFDGVEPMTFVILREGVEVVKKITPKVTELTTAFGGLEKRFTVGITPFILAAEPEMTLIKSDSISQSIGKGWNRTVDISVMTVMSFVKLIQGQVSVKNVGGMVSIGKAAKDSFEIGAQAFLMTMGILSVSLFILNLLPIPVLDGGHLVFYIIELVKGSPLSLRKMEIAQQVGFVLLMALMILAQFNDIVRYLFKS